jgi:hypothetical protein
LEGDFNRVELLESQTDLSRFRYARDERRIVFPANLCHLWQGRRKDFRHPGPVKFPDEK